MALLQHGFAAGFRFHEPGFKSEASTVADGDGTAVKLVGVVDGAFDEVDGLVDVHEGDGEAFAIDTEVVSEERLRATTTNVRRVLNRCFID